ncbi:MAG: S8 family serine peptidase [Haloplanus sp.]
MSNAAPRRRVALLTLVVVLAVVQPALGGVRAGNATTPVAGDVGTTVGGTVDRHPSSAGPTAEALRTVRADAVHARGLTGSGVDVGVIGRGFDTSGVIAPHVVARRQVGDPARRTAHDTAVAEIVSETAPSANLYLAGVGSTPTPAEYATAVQWLTDRGVDVIVDSGSYFPSVAADGRRITAAAERATAEGVVFVTSAGNYANRHWAGSGTDDDWVAFADGDAANALADGNRLRGRVTVRLRWRSAADYDLYLYRRLPNGPDRVVAKSVGDDTGPGRTVEGVDVAVPRGRYYLAVYADDPAPESDRVQVFAARHRLEHTTAHGSMVAPATSERVVAVGAAANGEPAAYSSLSTGGTVDLTAPGAARTGADATLAGTSAAAPYVAGTVALMASGEHDPSPARVEAILERTADGESDSLDALAAVEAATATGTDATGSSPRWGEAVTDHPVDADTDPKVASATHDRQRNDAAAAKSPVTGPARNATREGGRAEGEGRTTDGERTKDGRAEPSDRSSDSTERKRDGAADRPNGRDDNGKRETNRGAERSQNRSDGSAERGTQTPDGRER